MLEKLKAARARIAAGWCQHVMKSFSGGQDLYCAAGALGEDPMTLGVAESPEHRLLRECLPRRFNLGNYWDLAAFNDHRYTTKEDILALYDRAIVRAT